MSSAGFAVVASELAGYVGHTQITLPLLTMIAQIWDGVA